MPLPKPNPGDPLKANAITDNASYTEANKPLPGPGITIRRTPAGSTVGLSAAKQLATNGSDSADGGSGGGDGISDGTEIWGRVVWDTTSDVPVFAQYKLRWHADGKYFEEVADAFGKPYPISTLTSHQHAHGVSS